MVQPYMAREKAIEILENYLRFDEQCNNQDLRNATLYAIRDMKHIQKGRRSGPDPRD
ncbi:hypothetical protein ES703_56199 [subsurface metagenome]